MVGYPMPSSRLVVAAAAALSVFGTVVAGPVAYADPVDVQAVPPAPGIQAPAGPSAPADPAQAAPAAAPVDPGPADAVAPADNSAAVSACSTFARAIDYAATNYGEFADRIAGPDDNYAGIGVQDANVTGRTALRQAAGAVMDAANTPGLQADIADPMRSYSMHAAKLLVLMGLHSNGDSLNGTVTDMNADIHATQMGCAAAGTRA